MDAKLLERLPQLLDDIIKLEKSYRVVVFEDGVICHDKETDQIVFMKMHGDDVAIDFTLIKERIS